MQGVGEGKFAPRGTASRGMIVTILHRLEKEPAATGDRSFSDVGAEEWYSEPAKWAAENGIVEGYPDGRFGPNDNVTREQLATILYRYANKKELDVSGGGDLTAFSDGGDVSPWAEKSMAWANAKGLIKGMGDGTLNPDGNAERAQIAAILQRFCELYEL
jgi:hypothetical protein